MKFLNSSHAICIGAHPDDVEYGMLGTFLKYRDTHFRVIVLSGGGDFDKSTEECDRRGENENIWERLPNVVGEVKDGFVRDQAEDAMVDFVESRMYKLMTTVFTTPQLDSHFEHRMVNNIGPALCRRKPINLVEYRTPSALNTWIPNHFESLTEAGLKLKKKLLKLFKSQQHAPYFKSKAIDNFHYNFQASKRGVDIVESFRIVESFS
jgi:LmbE family N-acetylglucosaminyl deacetylase